MTILEAITQLDSLKHNTYSQADKVRWLSALDAMVTQDMIRTHRGGEDARFRGYDENTPLDTLLLAPQPFDKMYVYWLQSQVDYYNEEFDRYNHSMAMFTECYRAFMAFYNRTYEPLGKAFRYF